ncbi:perlucin-like isoform X2 [Ostrea edulis]|uniref:perlucin-like isoform X2 n=1 Tax=Ostrea edulis TaxID=37623 RepID=UPI00209650D4|nr:perlucin-like isoform X2 [Ostrea edulis]
MGKGGILLLAFVHTAVALTCPNGWTVNQNSCYHVSRDRESWVEATRMCELHGGYLAHIETAEEQTFMKQLLQRVNDHQYWLGGSDWTIEGKWIWEPRGVAFNFTSWSHGEPDNRHNEQHCLLLDTHSHNQWFDHDCNDARHYICENSDDVTGSLIG